MMNFQQELLQQDYPRTALTMLEPQAVRPHVQALLMLDYELRSIAPKVKEEMVGAIRFAWWREALEEMADGKTPRPHPVLKALHALAEAKLWDPREFITVVDAREAELDVTPFQAVDALYRYARESDGKVQAEWVKLSLRLQKKEADLQVVEVATQIGTAWGLVNTLYATANLAQEGKIRLPQALFGGEHATEEAMKAAGKAVAEEAQHLIEHARAQKPHMPRQVLPAFLLTRLAWQKLDRLHKTDFAPMMELQDAQANKRGVAWHVLAGSFSKKW